jgi:hypothetical protein
MNTKNILLIIAGLLILIGLLKPDISNLLNDNKQSNSVIINLEKPSEYLLDECELVIKSLKAGPSSRTNDGKNLASLYSDLAKLIALEEDKEIIKTTEEIRQANSLSGIMLGLDIDGVYPQLAENCNSVITSTIGEDNVSWDKELRKKAVEGFNALAWACNEGAK